MTAGSNSSIKALLERFTLAKDEKMEKVLVFAAKA